MPLGELRFGVIHSGLELIEIFRESLGNKGWGWEGKHRISNLCSTSLTIS